MSLKTRIKKARNNERASPGYHRCLVLRSSIVFRHIPIHTLLFLCLIAACGKPIVPAPAETALRFAVANVGQGLAQLAGTGGNGIAFDMGPCEGSAGWTEAYKAMGFSRILAIAISHDHADHWGGLQRLDSAAAWSGLIITHSGVDTGALRDSFHQWKSRIRFRVIAAGDTIGGLDGVETRCIWPPARTPGVWDSTDPMKNRYSLVFSIKKGATAALITSDIDSITTRELSLAYGARLVSDILVVPHHGSAASRDGVFYGHVHPSIAVISYGVGNPYGHPSESVLLWFSQMGLSIRETAQGGAYSALSNGFYWEEQSN